MKILVLGDSKVGKTSYINRLVNSTFLNDSKETIGCDIITMNSIEFRDVSGKDQYIGVRDLYYLGVDACIIMFDVCSRISFRNVKKWVADLKRINNVPCVLVGNKCESSKRKMTHNVIYALKEELNLKYCEISAKGNVNCHKPLTLLQL